MIGIPGPLLIAVLLLVLVVLLWAKGVSAAGQLSIRSDMTFSDDASAIAPCPPEFVHRIFSNEDLQFVSAANSPQLQKLFRRERQAVALVWVQQTSARIQSIIREHTQASRRASDLEFSTETKLVMQYAELMLICGVLFLVIRFAGPVWMRGLALHADTLSQRITQTGQAIKTATTAGAVPTASSS